jgi:hypothetical protein
VLKERLDGMMSTSSKGRPMSEYIVAGCCLRGHHASTLLEDLVSRVEAVWWMKRRQLPQNVVKAFLKNRPIESADMRVDILTDVVCSFLIVGSGGGQTGSVCQCQLLGKYSRG